MIPLPRDVCTWTPFCALPTPLPRSLRFRIPNFSLPMLVRVYFRAAGWLACFGETPGASCVRNTWWFRYRSRAFLYSTFSSFAAYTRQLVGLPGVLETHRRKWRQNRRWYSSGVVARVGPCRTGDIDVVKTWGPFVQFVDKEGGGKGRLRIQLGSRNPTPFPLNKTEYG